MKKHFTVLSIAAASLGMAQTPQGKMINHLPANAVVYKVQKPAFLADFPVTNWKDYADTSWYNAADTSFELSTAAELAGLAKLVAAGNTFTGKNIKLMQNVNIGAHLWDPIGYNNNNPFSGNFEGNNKVVSNLMINREGGDWLGLFGQFIGATVKNLTLDGARIYGTDTSGAFIANITTGSTVENCHVKNADITLTEYNGGIFTGAVLSNSTVMNCSAQGKITGQNQIGGFAGTSWNNSLISKSFVEGEVNGQYFVGGFTGFITFAFGPTVNKIEDSYSRANVTATVQSVGGFAGAVQNTGDFKNVYSTGTVSITPDVGAFIGTVGNIAIQNAYYDATVNTEEPVGAFMGAPLTLDITGKQTAEMKTPAFATTLNAGRTETIWVQNPAVNDGYPYLSSQPLLATGENIAQAKKISIAPTMVTDGFKVQGINAAVSYQIMDMSGKIVSSGKNDGDQISVAKLVKGVYLIKISGNGETTTLKFIKK